MLKLQNIMRVAIGASVPLAAYTGHYEPSCTWTTVWTFSGYHYQYVCF
jgi:hypothetical protein